MQTQNKPDKKTGTKVSLGYAWYALAVLFAINLLNYVDRLSIGPALEYLKRDFSISDYHLGLIASAFITVYAVLSLPMGYVSDKGRRTGIVALGVFVWSISTFLSGFCRSFWGFFAARGMVGSGEGIYAPSGTAIVADYFPKRLRNTAISIFMSAMIVGGAIAYIAAGLVLKKTEKFNIPLVSGVILDQGQKEINGWNLEGAAEQTKDRLVQFTFTNSTGVKIKAVLSKLNDKKQADFKSKLFNIQYSVEGGAGAGFNQEEIKKFTDFLNLRIAERESRGLEKQTAELGLLPSNFKIPDVYKQKLVYDEKAKQLIFFGIMTKEDHKALESLSDNEQYIKAIGSIYSNSRYHYLRSDNWRWIFWIFGPPGLILALLAYFLKEPLKGGTEEFLSEDEAKKVDQAGKANYSVLFKTPSIVIMIFANILATYCIGGLNTWLFPFVERYKGIESADAALKIGPIVVLCAVAGVIFSGVLADKLSKITPRGNNYIIVAGLLLGTPFMYIFLYTTSFFMTVFSISACIFFMTWINGPHNALLMSLVEPRLRAMLNGVHILLIHIFGDAISPPIIGYLSDTHGLRFALAMLPLFLIAGTILFAIAAIYVPNDLKAMENRMKSIATAEIQKP